MIRISLFFLCLIVSGSLLAQKKYFIKGTLNEPNAPVKIYFSTGSTTDSTLLVNGKFSFEGKLTNPFKGTIYTAEINSKEKYPKREYLSFYVDEGVTTLYGLRTIKTALVKGGKTQREYQKLQDSLQWIRDLYDNISSIVRSSVADDTTKARVQGLYKILYPKSDAIEYQFIKNHPSSVVSWDIVSNRGVIINPDLLEPLFNLLSKDLQESEKGKLLKERIETAKRFKIGNPAIDFTINDSLGNPVSLSSYKGKYVLLDFWASWCGPCRAENPNMLKTYTNLKDKNFEILGVSLDEKRDRWLKAIEEDKLPWKQVSDLKGFTTIAKIYDIRAIPQNYLIDPEGKIIAKNIRGENMEMIIKKYMGL